VESSVECGEKRKRKNEGAMGGKGNKEGEMVGTLLCCAPLTNFGCHGVSGVM
jgi:hypothetical protein